MDKLRLSDARILLFIGAISDMQRIISVCTEGLPGASADANSGSGSDGGSDGESSSAAGSEPASESVSNDAADVNDSGGGMDSASTSSGSSGSVGGAPPLGMYGPGYQWIGLHSCMYTTLFTDASGRIVPAQYAFAQGMLGLQNFADTESALYAAYAASWAAQPPAPDLPSVQPSDPRSMTLPAHFAYDAVWFLAHAIDAMERDGVDLARASPAQKERFRDTLLVTTFQGVTGHIAVDQKGDRFGTYAAALAPASGPTLVRARGLGSGRLGGRT